MAEPIRKRQEERGRRRQGKEGTEERRGGEEVSPAHAL